MIIVDVLVLTYKRPALLVDALRSLSRQQLPDGIDMQVIVIDNDAAQSGRDIVRELQAEVAALRYVCEPVPNISAARNRGLREARGGLVAFIDDDELADPRWLASLLDTRQRFDAAMVFGPVIPRLPDATASWIRRGGFFERPRAQTGPTTALGGTGNVLLDPPALAHAGMMFDLAFGRSGGEDTEFFHRLRQSGCVAAWCDEAVVWEQVTSDRTTIGWLLRRAFNSGNNYARIFDRRGSASRRCTRLFRHACVCVTCLLLTPIALLGGAASAVRAGRCSARNLGRIVGLLSAREIPRAAP